MGPVIEIDPNYVALRRALWSKRAIAGLEDCREIPDFSLQAIINSHWKLQVQNSLLVVDKWQPDLTAENLLVNQVAIWLHFSGLPMELISNYVAYSLGELAGEVVDLDLVNESGKNLEFIRVKSLYGAASSASVVMSKSCNISMDQHPPTVPNIITADWSSESSEEEQAPSIHLSSSKGHHQSSGNISPPSIGNYNDDHVDQQDATDTTQRGNHFTVPESFNEEDMIDPTAEGEAVNEEYDANDEINPDDLDGSDDDNDYDPMDQTCDICIDAMELVYQSHCGPGPLPMWAKQTAFQLSQRVQDMFEDNFMGWTGAPIFITQTSSVYGWASVTFKQGEGLGLILHLTNNAEVKWDVYAMWNYNIQVSKVRSYFQDNSTKDKYTQDAEDLPTVSSCKRKMELVINPLAKRNLSYTCFVGTDLIGRSGGTFYCLAKGSMLQHFGDILWNWFIDKSKFMNKPWIAIGDFNQIRYHHNKISKSNRVDGAGVFNQMIQICDFTDLNPTGTWCTWTNGRGSEVWARLDRTLCSDDWLQSYPCPTFSSLPVAASAHSPLIVDSCGVKPFCKRPFRFENLWLMFDKCNVVVNQSWETDVNSSPSVILHEKFNFLRGNLRIWNSHEDILGYYKGRCRSPTSFFFDNGTFTDHLNKSFITLIPKTNAPQSFKDFRHISLANVSYKLITKVLCSRLKCFLPDLIAPNQSAFLKGRLITDNIVLATELMHKIRMVKQEGGGGKIMERPQVGKIECLMANFFWGHNGNRPKIHLQKWQDLNIPKDEGGLVLCNISAFNEALLAKHIWRLIDHNNSLVDITLAPKFRDSDGNFVARSNSPGDGILSLKLKI
ncbi:putative ribonuclease H protein [Senna tora]|uniref:Putative ribonuclease H protein n=1 Tax=Senna tora TaxID=362788 RepID=A0A834W615_9FABA|nr:putative ribonuclease H protein [Senna tora]